MKNYDVDEIYTAAYQTIERYFNAFEQRPIFEQQNKQLDEELRHTLFPIVVSHLTSDVSVPLQVKTDNLQRVIEKLNAFQFAEKHFHDKENPVLIQFFESSDFKQMCSELKTQKNRPDIQNVKNVFAHNYKYYSWKNKHFAVYFDVETSERDSEHNKEFFKQRFNTMSTPYTLEDVLQYHKSHMEHLAGIAMNYINVMEQTLSQSVPHMTSMKDRLTARRGSDVEADTITIETGTEASQEPEHIQKRAAP